MRPFAALALVLVLLAVSPAQATLGDDLDSEHQTEGYGRIFAYVCSAAAALVIILVGVHVVRGMMDESRRGKKPGYMPEAVLDEATTKKKKEAPLYLGEKVPDWKLSNRQPATAAALKFMSRKDEWFETKYLADVVDRAFREIKAAIESRTTKKIGDLVTAGCLDRLKSEVQKLGKRGDVHVFGRVDITDILVVHLEAPARRERHTFTALISARSKDYYQDEKTGEVLRGDKKTYSYNEFWQFRRTAKGWLVDLIRTSSDMDTVLHAKNVMTQADLDKFAKTADEDYLREFVAG